MIIHFSDYYSSSFSRFLINKTSQRKNKKKMSAKIGKPAPEFKATAVVDGNFKDISLKDFKGKYVVLFFYPLDFTFVCPTGNKVRLKR